MARWNGFHAQINLAALEALEEAEVLADDGRRQFFDFINPFDELSNRSFIKLFRLNKELAGELIEVLEPYLTPPSRASALSSTRKVLTMLRFCASGSYQLDIGRNINLGISQSSVSRCVAEVTDALNHPDILNTYISFPRNYEELNRVRNEFYEEHQFPGVVGCIDCTHVAIFPPKNNDPVYPEALYVNRKGYHSINVQLICDSKLRIRNVSARFPGSTHDNFIWNQSGILPLLQNIYNTNRNGSYYLLGDSGYALRPWILTPLPQAVPHTPEARYNERQKSTRSLIERCNGVLKLRFRCLLKHRVLHYGPTRASKIINACCILHNWCVENNLPPIEPGDEEEEEDLDFGMYDDEQYDEPVIAAVNRINPDLAAGRRVQQRVIRNHFAL